MFANEGLEGNYWLAAGKPAVLKNVEYYLKNIPYYYHFLEDIFINCEIYSILK